MIRLEVTQLEPCGLVAQQWVFHYGVDGGPQLVLVQWGRLERATKRHKFSQRGGFWDTYRNRQRGDRPATIPADVIAEAMAQLAPVQVMVGHRTPPVATFPPKPCPACHPSNENEYHGAMHVCGGNDGA